MSANTVPNPVLASTSNLVHPTNTSSTTEVVQNESPNPTIMPNSDVFVNYTPTTATANRNKTSKNKRGRSTDMYVAEIYLFLREVFAAHAHIAPQGAKTERFEIVSHALNSRRNFSVGLDFESKCDGYKRLQRTFNK